MPEGLDFALLWKGVWREGRCYASFSGRTFVTNGDAQPLTTVRRYANTRPNYALETGASAGTCQHLRTRAGYTSTQLGEIVDVNTTIEAGENMEVAIPMENGKRAADHHQSPQQRGYPPARLK